MSIEPFSSGKKSVKTQYSSYIAKIPTYKPITTGLSIEFSIADPNTSITKNTATNRQINCNLLSRQKLEISNGILFKIKLSIMLNTHIVNLKKK